MVVREIKDVRRIRAEYEQLARRARPYQKYEMLLSVLGIPDSLKARSLVRCFCVYDDAGRLVLIAPLRIHGGRARMVGDSESYNMSDLIYDTEDCALLEEAICALLRHLRRSVFGGGGFVFEWWFLCEDMSWRALRNLRERGVIAFDAQPVNNVQIPLPESYELYLKTLSKHARQNLRTAGNRLVRDGHTMQVHFYPIYEGDPAVKKKARKAFGGYMDLYVKRREQRYQADQSRTWMLQRLLYRYLGYGWASAFFPMTLLADISIDGETAAFLKSYVDRPHRTVTVPVLAIDQKWGFYSPGILLVAEFVRHLIELGGIDTLSMGRGEEKYKFDMGGEIYTTQNLEIRLLEEREESC